jgi:hypothetical protein
MTERPTPESDAFAEHLFTGAPAQSARFPTNTEWLAFARRLEQKNAAMKEALEAQLPGPYGWQTTEERRRGIVVDTLREIDEAGR